jgi:hypothetical protein
MDLFHCRAGVLHSIECFFIDIRRLYAINLALEGHNLSTSLVEGMFKLLLPSKGGFRSYMVNLVSKTQSRAL